MNKVVKQKLIFSIFCIIIGILFFVYPIIFKGSVEEELHSYMNGFASGIIGLGLYVFVISIIALNSPNKGKKLEIELKDERLNKITESAMAITLRITLIAEAIVSMVSAFTNNMHISKYIGIVIAFQLIMYLIVYFFVRRNN